MNEYSFTTFINIRVNTKVYTYQSLDFMHIKVSNAPGEVWHKIAFKGTTKGKDYFISNYGRTKSVDKFSKEENLMKATMLKTGFPKITYRLKEGCESIYPHKTVAQYFVPKPSEKHEYVIHIDMNRKNNCTENLKWVTEEERKNYNKKRAVVFGYNKKEHVRGVGNYKLTEAKVAIIKKQLSTGKTRKSMIAKRFGITLTQIKRIETGENWSNVKPAK